MAYAPIAKLEKFSGEENDAQTWINNIIKAITANNWDNIRGDTEAVITYLRRFYQNLHQIQIINADYFTTAQILNQFIHRLCSSILQHIWPLHSVNLQDAVTCTRDFELAELEANHKHESFPKLVASIIITQSAVAVRYASLPQLCNIPPATVTEDELFTAIFLFEVKELLEVSLFNKAALEEKPITAIYTDAKIDGHFIKLILNSGLAGSIITRQLMDQLNHRVDRTASARIIIANRATKTLIGKIDDLFIKVNGIAILIKILVIEATQYQALIGNDWLFKTNAILDWNIQKLQLSQNSQHTCVPATCGHFKTTNMPAPLIKFEKKEKKPTWKAY
ncbi:hypothetical protein G9A89_000862 [Geosiphon pyriformis]|nr:hypothetical protein G9A89_000862 [Geosiphon pyriformis]